MRVCVTYILEHDEVAQLGYRLICESMGGSLWKTGKVKRAYEEHFNEQERHNIKFRLYPKAYQWYLKTGVPDKVEMSELEYKLWVKLKDFCVKYCTVYGGSR